MSEVKKYQDWNKIAELQENASKRLEKKEPAKSARLAEEAKQSRAKALYKEGK